MHVLIPAVDDEEEEEEEEEGNGSCIFRDVRTFSRTVLNNRFEGRVNHPRASHAACIIAELVGLG